MFSKRITERVSTFLYCLVAIFITSPVFLEINSYHFQIIKTPLIQGLPFHIHHFLIPFSFFFIRLKRELLAITCIFAVSSLLLLLFISEDFTRVFYLLSASYIFFCFAFMEGVNIHFLRKLYPYLQNSFLIFTLLHLSSIYLSKGSLFSSVEPEVFQKNYFLLIYQKYTTYPFVLFLFFISSFWSFDTRKDSEKNWDRFLIYATRISYFLLMIFAGRKFIYGLLFLFFLIYFPKRTLILSCLLGSLMLLLPLDQFPPIERVILQIKAGHSFGYRRFFNWKMGWNSFHTLRDLFLGSNFKHPHNYFLSLITRNGILLLPLSILLWIRYFFQYLNKQFFLNSKDIVIWSLIFCIGSIMNSLFILPYFSIIFVFLFTLHKKTP